MVTKFDTDEDKARFFSGKKRNYTPCCIRCGEPIKRVDYVYVNSKTGGEKWWHYDCFLYDILKRED